jgi:hypothetical protein
MEDRRMAKTLIGALEEIAHKIPGAGGGGNIVDTLAVYSGALSKPNGGKSSEELELCYTAGTLEFIESKSKEIYGLLDMKLYNLDGQENGRYEVVWKPVLKEIEGKKIKDIPAKEYEGPFDKVEEEILSSIYPMRANSNAKYTFEGRGGTPKGSLYATGPADLILTPLKDGGSMFQVSVAAYVTGGTEDFEKARGTNTALGSSYIPKGFSLSPPPIGQKIPGVTVSTFRIVRKEHQA